MLERAPALDAEIVDRSELVRRSLASSARVFSIVAPAGFGKSYFARELLATMRHGRTVDCAEMHTIADAVRALLRALGPFDPALEQQQARYALALPRDGSGDAQWIDVLEEALRATSGSSVLCVENGELLAGRPAIADLIERTVRNAARRFVFCSRVPISLAALARIPPNEQCFIGIDDLRFSDKEIAGLLSSSPSDQELVSRAIALSGGWPIAVLMMVNGARAGRLDDLLRALAEGVRVSSLHDYTLSQALESLSVTGRSVLAAASHLRRIDIDDLRAMTDDWEDVDAQFLSCPFVTRVGDEREVHPLAVTALAPLRSDALFVLRRAALRRGDPLRAAQFYLAAGDQDAVADILDTSLAPFMLDQPATETAALVASLDVGVLLRHPATWNATWMGRAFTVPSHRMLFESRTVWATLRADAPMPLRYGVGLSVLNWLFFTGPMDEMGEIFDALEVAIAGAGPVSLGHPARDGPQRGPLALTLGKGVCDDPDVARHGPQCGRRADRLFQRGSGRGASPLRARGRVDIDPGL